ncbi:MAG: DUF4301 family protein [Chlamydiota bacterium]|nr:DUF4301 family protein [Chlamydiota bacterium]
MQELLKSPTVIKQLREKGISTHSIAQQITFLHQAQPSITLLRPCTIKDGISVIKENDTDPLLQQCTKAAKAGEIIKFVPASGASSRMFNTLIKDYQSPTSASNADLLVEQFFSDLKKFAFYEDLFQALSHDHLSLEDMIKEKQFHDILEYVLTSKGLNYANLSKGFIKFHRYFNDNRSAVEEHFHEAASVFLDQKRCARIHFTISQDSKTLFEEHIRQISSKLSTRQLYFEITYSYQKPSTDTIALKMDDSPLLNNGGELIFRPGGHGALLENLSDLEGDFIYLKNIDNIATDTLRETTSYYQKLLCGLLITLQKKIFSYLERLSSDHPQDLKMEDIFNFMRAKLFIDTPAHILASGYQDQKEYCIQRLNRPLRVCGMVKNESEPGGGPFWVKDPICGISLQIVEQAEVNLSDPEQEAIWKNSTHFNPVDICCAIRDFRGNKFNLSRFRDDSRIFIAIKSKDGQTIKALELPGLWNGGMAYWNTVFIEIPVEIFNPVKTVFDLLRKEHQP